MENFCCLVNKGSSLFLKEQKLSRELSMKDAMSKLLATVCVCVCVRGVAVMGSEALNAQLFQKCFYCW